jgi:predicted nucleic acid-binding protein
VIVVDTSVVAYLFLPGDHTEAARAALAVDAAWAAPLLWRSEFRNVLALYLREGHLALAAALRVQAAAEGMLAGREYAVDSAAVLRLAATSGRSAYDCEFVALAQALAIPLVTSDRQLLARFPEMTVALSAFAVAARGTRALRNSPRK